MCLIDLKSFSKVSLLSSSTEIQYLSQISNIFGVNLYIKRDDQNGVGFGGNKVRKLEYLLGEAQVKNATHILTLGAVQSNHARLTAITSRMKGFEVELFLKESVEIHEESYQQNGNVLLNRIVDVKMHRIPNDPSMMMKIEARMEEIRLTGGIPYFIPVGGSNAIGNLGYIDCYSEIIHQQEDLNVSFDYIVSASGSGGTHAGLVLGKVLTKNDIKVVAYNVQPEHDELEEHTLKICNETLELLGEEAIKREDIVLNSNYGGKAYGFPEYCHVATLKFLAIKEGVFLDPVYTAKAFYGLLEDIKAGLYPEGSNIVFIHTGGTSGLFAYNDWF